MLYLTNIDLNQNELQTAIVQPLAVAPSNPKLGQIYTNSVNSRIMWYNGSEWQTIGVVVESSEINGNIIEVKSMDGLLNEKTPIVVNRITDGIIFVEKLKS